MRIRKYNKVISSPLLVCVCVNVCFRESIFKHKCKKSSVQ